MHNQQLNTYYKKEEEHSGIRGNDESVLSNQSKLREEIGLSEFIISLIG